MMLFVAHEKRAGFTLIEVMIVIAIIAILAGIVMPNIAMARFEAGITACQENCRLGLAAIQMARVRHTWKEVADMLDDGYYDVGGTEEWKWESCGGTLGGKFIEFGYLGRLLRCKTTDSLYSVRFGGYNGYSFDYCKDWQKDEWFSVKSPWCYVICDTGSGHALDGAEYGVWVMYEESVGPCFSY